MTVNSREGPRSPTSDPVTVIYRRNESEMNNIYEFQLSDRNVLPRDFACARVCYKNFGNSPGVLAADLWPRLSMRLLVASQDSQIVME